MTRARLVIVRLAQLVVVAPILCLTGGRVASIEPDAHTLAAPNAIAAIGADQLPETAPSTDYPAPRTSSGHALTGPFWQQEPREAAALAAQRYGGAGGFSSPEIERHIDRIMAVMDDEARVAQLLMVSWDDEAPTPEVMRWIRRRGIGGVKVFGWNGEDLPTLARAIETMQTAALDRPAGIPLFVATDQEGGWVRHVKDGTSITPGNMAIGATALPFDALKTGRYIGLELRALGINMNFAPTVDVYRNPEAHVIGPRAFSSDPTLSGLLGVAYYRGMQEAGVIATAKHFPGHGNATGDSHGILPVITDSYDTLWEIDLVPFRMLVREGVPAILSGHLSFPTITGTNTPASISSYFKQRVLRDELAFGGIVITDDLHMGGALEYGRERGWSFAQLVKRAIEVGNDVVMVSQTPAFDGDVWQTLITAYREEEAFRRRVDESVRRNLRVKLSYLADETRVPLTPNADGIHALMRSQESQAFFLDQAARSLTIVADERLPLDPSTAGETLLVGNDPYFLRVGRATFPTADTLRLREPRFYSSSAYNRRAVREAAARYDTVIFLLSDPGSLEILQAAADHAERIIVYSILTPIYLAEVPWVESAIATYGWGIESFESGFAALTGAIPAPGRLPVGTALPGGGAGAALSAGRVTPAGGAALSAGGVAPAGGVVLAGAALSAGGAVLPGGGAGAAPAAGGAALSAGGAMLSAPGRPAGVAPAGAALPGGGAGAALSAPGRPAGVAPAGAALPGGGAGAALSAGEVAPAGGAALSAGRVAPAGAALPGGGVVLPAVGAAPTPRRPTTAGSRNG